MSACEVKTYKAERLMNKQKIRDENVKLVLDSSMKLENSWRDSEVCNDEPLIWKVSLKVNLAFFTDVSLENFRPINVKVV